MSLFFLNSAAILFLFIILTQQGASQLTLTPSSSTACPGDKVTLVCHHPEVATNAQRYLITVPAWRENGRSIRLAPGTRYQATTAADLTSTTLTFTISSEQFIENSYSYFCFLILAATREDETSANAMVVIPELSSPVLTSTSSLESSITVEWLDVSCSRSYNISWQCMEPSSNGSTTNTNTNITVPVNRSTECTLSLVAVYGDGSTGPSSTAVVHPGYPRPTADPSASTSQDLILTCQFGGVEYTDIQWTSSHGPVDSSGNQLTLNYTTLQRGTEFWCSGVPMRSPYRVIGHSYIYNGATCPPVVSPPTAPPSTGIALIASSSIGGVLVAVIIFIAGGASGVLAQVLYRKVAAKKSSAPPSSPPAPSYGHTQGDVGAGPEMTDNPSYQLVERSQDSKQLYQNL